MNSTFIADNYAVSPQIAIADIAEIKKAGFVGLVINRPDGEEAGQPTAAEIDAEAKAQDLPFIWLPMNGPNMSLEQVDTLDEFIEAHSGNIFAFCRSGNRSSIIYNVWLQNKT